MRQEDYLLPSYRDNGALLWRGMKMEEILLYWGGDERGNCSSGPNHDFPFCIRSDHTRRMRPVSLMPLS
jgi:2-oxoisovalerate dehydrogenase E1 component subunit alpha